MAPGATTGRAGIPVSAGLEPLPSALAAELDVTREDSMRMSDPLIGFDWSGLYARYDERCRGFDPSSIHLEAAQPVPATDRSMYYHLVRASLRRSEARSALDIGQYEALLYWKLNSNPQALGQLRTWMRKDESRRRRNAEQLQRLLSGMPPAIPQQLLAVTELLDRIDQYQLDGMKSPTSFPVRSTFLHIRPFRKSLHRAVSAAFSVIHSQIM